MLLYVYAHIEGPYCVYSSYHSSLPHYDVKIIGVNERSFEIQSALEHVDWYKQVYPTFVGYKE